MAEIGVKELWKYLAELQDCVESNQARIAILEHVVRPYDNDVRVDNGLRPFEDENQPREDNEGE